MEVEKDLIKREIQKITLLLNSLIEKVIGLNTKNANSGIEKVNETLKTHFDLSLNKIAEIQNSELIKKISGFHNSHIEKIVELIYEIVMKTELSGLEHNVYKKKLAIKGIVMIDFLNKQSNTFSIKRMHIKNKLQHKSI